MSTRLTLYGLYNWDNTLFDGLVLPPRFNRADMINVIIEKSGDLYPYYQVPDRLKNNITVWARRMYHQFEEMIEVLYEDYDPLENYNRFENSTHIPKETVTTTHSGEDTNEVETTLGSYSTNDRAAFDSDNYSPVDKTTNGGGDSSTSTDNYGHVITEQNGGTHDFASHIHGNIGVMTSQNMAEQEIELRKFDIYNEIAGMFEDEFIVRIY